MSGEGAGELRPCPFCGGEAEIFHIDEGENAGGSCVCCKRCMASSNVEFEFKENFVDNWNRRSGEGAGVSEAMEPVWLQNTVAMIEASSLFSLEMRQRCADLVKRAAVAERHEVSSGVIDDIAKIIDPHSFFPYDGDDDLIGEIVRQDLALARSKASRILSALTATQSVPAPGGWREALPVIPDDDADFTPDLARKIIAKYQELLSAPPAPEPVAGAVVVAQRGSSNPRLTIPEARVREFLRTIVDEAGYADREMLALQVYAGDDKTPYLTTTGDFVLMVSNIPNSRTALAQPAPAAQAINAAQITMGRGLVDVTQIKHEGRSGILFRPRNRHIPVGNEGELQAGEYWPVDGDVVIWIENEAGAKVIQTYLAPFLPAAQEAPSGAVEIETPELERIYQAAKSLANNIAEFGTITDGEYLDGMDTALAALAERQPQPQEGLKPAGWLWKQKGRTDADAWSYSYGHPQLSDDLYVTEPVFFEGE